MPCVEYRDPHELKNHPVNIQIYGDKPDQDFVDKVRRHGILEPLTILPVGTVLSGHRRKQAARIVGVEQVPVIVRDDLTEQLDIEEVVVVSNEYREKTNEQKAREYGKLKEIEEERARQRQATSTGGANPQLQENFPEADKGQARDKAAQHVGWSGRTAEKGAAVEQEIKTAEESGDHARAEELRGALNSSVNRAYNLLEKSPQPGEGAGQQQTRPTYTDKNGTPVPETLHPVWELTPKFDEVLDEFVPRVQEYAKDIHRAIFGDAPESATSAGNFQAAEAERGAKIVHDVFSRWRPRYVCDCDGQGCSKCQGRGWNP